MAARGKARRFRHTQEGHEPQSAQVWAAVVASEVEGQGEGWEAGGGQGVGGRGDQWFTSIVGSFTPRSTSADELHRALLKQACEAKFSTISAWAC